mgnify:CR=1 FL=1
MPGGSKEYIILFGSFLPQCVVGVAARIFCDQLITKHISLPRPLVGGLLIIIITAIHIIVFDY